MTDSNCLVLVVTATLGILSVTIADKVFIEPILEFRDAEGSHFFPPPKRENMTSYHELLDFIPLATEVCSTGVWIFYPQTNFLFNEKKGTIIGDNEKYKCVILTEEKKTLLSSMNSYRHLGPEQDISVKSITLYSEPCFGGRSFSVLEGEGDQKLLNIPLIFPVKSYVITAPTHDSKTENEAPEQKTLIRLYETFDVTPVGPKTCLALVNHDQTPMKALAKMYYRKVLLETDHFGSLEFKPYLDDHIIIGGFCDYTEFAFVDVPPRL